MGEGVCVSERTVQPGKQQAKIQIEMCNKSDPCHQRGLVTLTSEVCVIPRLVKWVIKIVG